MKLYTSKLYTNQIFKNYKELCAFFDEKPTTGCSKQAQFKEWERYFSYRKEGNKFIVTEVFDTTKDKTDNRVNNYSRNNKNVKPMMDYLMSEFNTEYIDEYFTISNWSTIVLHLMNKEVCDKTYRDDDEVFQFCGENNILDPKLFRDYVGTVKFVTKNLITTAFRGLQKRGLLEYQDGYKFYYEGAKYNRTVCVDGEIINDCIDNIEKEICQEIQNEFYADKNIKGKQLVYILRHSKNKELLKLYNSMRVDALNENDDVCCAVNDAIMERDDTTYQSGDFVDGTDGCRLLNYYKAYRITAFDDSLPKVDNKQEVIEIIKSLALRSMLNVNYTTKWGEIIHPYDNQDTLDEIRKINNVLFRDVKKVVTPMDIVEEVFDEFELDRIFNMEYLAS